MTDTTPSPPVVDVYAVGLVYCSVCAPANMSMEVLTHAVNVQAPTGIGSRWRLSDDPTFASGEPQPGPCSDPERLHYLFSC